MTPHRLEPARSGMVIVYLLAAIVIVTLLAASRSAALPDSPPDVQSSGVPLDQRAATGFDDRSGTPSSPAPATGAGSEGTPVPTSPMPASHVGAREGFISHMGAGYPRWYLALPCKHGNVRCHLTVRLCGPADCVTIRQTDYGPSQRLFPDRIADVSPWLFERLCGVPASFGLCNGSWTVVAGVQLPATDGGS
jgi:hypothetical protein